MRENRTYGSDGGEVQAFPTPITKINDSRFAGNDGTHSVNPSR